VPEWLGPAREHWWAEVNTWIRARCAERGAAVSAILSVKERPWSAVLSVELAAPSAGDSRVWFKACGQGGRHEPALLALLQDAPLLPRLLAHDTERGWLLTFDAGTPLCELDDATLRQQHLCEALRRYARLQRDFEARVEPLRALGLPDWRPHRLVDLLRRFAASAAYAGAPQSTSRRDSLHAVLPRLRGLCERLHELDPRASIEHGDLRGGNLLLSGTGVSLCDWGDTSIGQPLVSLWLALTNELARIDRTQRAVVAGRLIAAAGVDAGSAAPALAAAMRLAPWVRVLDFDRMLAGAPEHAVAPWRPHADAALDTALRVVDRPTGEADWLAALDPA
jgi:Phosphotransferase enzyme family